VIPRLGLALSVGLLAPTALAGQALTGSVALGGGWVHTDSHTGTTQDLLSGVVIGGEGRLRLGRATLDLAYREGSIATQDASDTRDYADGLLLLPYFLGEKTPLHDPYARGTLVGLGLHHTLGHIWRAALEGVCFGFRHHVEVFEELGQSVRHVVASDGGAASPLWMRIAADVLGRPVHLLQGHPGSCLGAAYVAAVGVGALDDWDGIGRFVTPAGVVEPDPANAALYRERYALFRDTYRHLQPLYPRLAGEDGMGR